MTDPDAFERESGGFAPGCSFLKKGTVHEGYITARRVVADMDPKTKKPKFFENSGEPKKVMVYTLDTEERDDEIEDDDGTRSLWARWKIMDAIKSALEEAGAKNTEIGGWLSVKYVSQDKPAGPGLSGVKNFEAVYEPPEEGADANEYEDAEEEEEAPPPRSRRKPAKKAAAKKATPARRRRAEPEPEEDEYEEDEPEEEAPPPRRSRRRRAEPEPEEDEYEEEAEEEAPPPRSRRKPAKKAPARKAGGRRRMTEDAAF